MTDKYIIFSFSLIRFSLFKSFSCLTAYAFLSLFPLLKSVIQAMATSLSIPSHLSSGDAAHLLYRALQNQVRCLSIAHLHQSAIEPRRSDASLLPIFSRASQNKVRFIFLAHLFIQRFCRTRGIASHLPIFSWPLKKQGGGVASLLPIFSTESVIETGTMHLSCQCSLKIYRTRGDCFLLSVNSWPLKKQGRCITIAHLLCTDRYRKTGNVSLMSIFCRTLIT